MAKKNGNLLFPKTYRLFTNCWDYCGDMICDCDRNPSYKITYGWKMPEEKPYILPSIDPEKSREFYREAWEALDANSY